MDEKSYLKQSAASSINSNEEIPLSLFDKTLPMKTLIISSSTL